MDVIVKRKFNNSHQKTELRGLGHFLLWCLGFYNDNKRLEPPPKDFIYPNPSQSVNPLEPVVTWVNHSTFIITIGGKTILTDPIWSKRASPLKEMGPKRKHPPQPLLEVIPKIDFVIISHDHYDHLDQETVKKIHKLHPDAIWLVPLGVKKIIQDFFECAQIYELKWWQSESFGDLTFTAVPAQHFSGRGICDKNHTLWMGCVVEQKLGKKFYFVGDTGYNPFDFKEIGTQFGEIDLGLIPIGTYTPVRFMRPVHINPKEAVMIHQEIHSKLSVGGHWKTFCLSEEPMDRPPFDLYHALIEAKLPVENFRVLNPGQSINW